MLHTWLTLSDRVLCRPEACFILIRLFLIFANMYFFLQPHGGILCEWLIATSLYRRNAEIELWNSFILFYFLCFL